MKVVQGRDPRELRVMYTARNLGRALESIAMFADHMPKGYTWATMTVSRSRRRVEGRTPGQAASVSIVILHSDQRELALDPDSAEAWFNEIEEFARVD